MAKIKLTETYIRNIVRETLENLTNNISNDSNSNINPVEIFNNSKILSHDLWASNWKGELILYLENKNYENVELYIDFDIEGDVVLQSCEEHEWPEIENEKVIPTNVVLILNDEEEFNLLKDEEFSKIVDKLLNDVYKGDIFYHFDDYEYEPYDNSDEAYENYRDRRME